MTDVITAVPRDQIPFIWPKVAELLKPSLDLSRGRHSVESQFDRLIDGTDHLWVMTNDDHTEIVAAVTFNFLTYPAGLRVLQLMFIGGSGWKKWGDELDRKMTQLAEETGCECIEHCGRKGWKRTTKRMGYELEYVHYRKDIANVE